MAKAKAGIGERTIGKSRDALSAAGGNGFEQARLEIPFESVRGEFQL